MKSLTNTTLKLLKTATCCAALVLAANSKAFAAPADEFGGANPDAATTNKNILDAKAITAKKTELKKSLQANACRTEDGKDSSQCVLFSMNNDNKGVTFSVFAGQGMQNPMGQGAGTNYYIQTSPNNVQNPNQLSYGIQVSWHNNHCHSEVLLDKHMYDVYAQYTDDMLNPTPGQGEAKSFPQFTPAQQAMILFYGTIAQLAAKNGACN